jgi:hypothetical protein
MTDIPDRLAFALPPVIEPADIEEIAARLRRELDELADELAREGTVA